MACFLYITSRSDSGFDRLVSLNSIKLLPEYAIIVRLGASAPNDIDLWRNNNM